MVEPVHILEGGVPDLARRARLGRRGGRERARFGPVCRSLWPGMGGRCPSIVNRMVRSTSVPITELRSPRM